MLISSFYLGWSSHRNQIRSSYLEAAKELLTLRELEMVRRAQKAAFKRMQAQSQMYRDEQRELENRVRNELRQPFGDMERFR
jgi:hypothetical protein